MVEEDERGPILSSKKKKKKGKNGWREENPGNVELEQLWDGEDWAGLPEVPAGPPRAEGAALDYLCVRNTLASGNLNRDSPSLVHLARVSSIGINLSYMYPELLKSLKKGPTIPIHFSLRVCEE